MDIKYQQGQFLRVTTERRFGVELMLEGGIHRASIGPGVKVQAVGLQVYPPNKVCEQAVPVYQVAVVDERWFRPEIFQYDQKVWTGYIPQPFLEPLPDISVPRLVPLGAQENRRVL